MSATARGGRCVVMAMMLVALMACRREERAQASKETGEAKRIAVTGVPTATPTVAQETGAAEKKETVGAAAEGVTTGAARLIVSGHVTLSDGAPATSATVQLVKFDQKEGKLIEEIIKTTSADHKGYYQLVSQTGQIPAWHYMVFGSRAESARVGVPLYQRTPEQGAEILTGTREVTVDLVLLAAGRIGGMVIDDQNKPVEQVTVSAFAYREQARPQGVSRSEVITDAKGKFVIEDMPAGKVALSVDSPKHVALSEEVTAPVENVVLRLTSQGASLGGHVYLLSTGEAVSDTTVQLHLQDRRTRAPMSIRPAKTDQQGAFRFERLPAGSYFIMAQKGNLGLLPAKEGRGHVVTLGEKESKSGIELFLYAGHTVKGKVTAKDGGAPIEGVKVSAAWMSESEKYSDVTDAQGGYMLTGLAQQAVQLKFEKQGYVVVREQQYQPYIVVQLSPDNLEVTKNAEMTRSVTISGRVENAEGVPVGSAKVGLHKTYYSPQRDELTAVNESGEFTLETEPFQACRIKAQAPDYASGFSDMIEVQDSPVKDVVVVLRVGATISGLVVDPEDHPVEGASVNSWQMVKMAAGQGIGDNSGLATSDANGKFTLTKLPATEITLSAQKEGFTASKQEKIVLEPGEAKTDVKLTLRKSNFLAGKITNAKEEPIEGVSVSLHANAPGESSYGHAQTDAEGKYRVEGLVSMPHNVSLNHADYGNEYHQNIEVGRDDADFVMGEKGKVTFIGKVVDWKSATPIVDFTVTSQNVGQAPEKSADKPGQFVYKNLNANFTYTFRIEASGYEPLNTDFVVMPGGRDTFEMTFKMGPGGTIVGRVVKRETKEPLAGVKVQLKGTGNQWEVSRRTPLATATTAEDGKFRFEKVSQGRNTVGFLPPSPLTARTKQVDITHGEVADMGDVEMGGGGIIKGRVVQMPDEEAVVGTRVVMQSQWNAEEHQKTTNEKGEFEFVSLPNGMYSLRVPDYDAGAFVELNEDETQERIIRIGTGVLKGKVLKSGRPTVAYVYMRQTNLGESKNATSDAEGMFEIKNLAPGRWQVGISPQQQPGQGMSEWIDIAADKVTERTFEFPTGRIVGKVVDANNAGVEGAMVSAQRSRPADSEDNYVPRTWTATSNDDGSFAIEALNGDSYGVSANKEGKGMSAVVEVQVPPNGDSQPVVLRLVEGQGGTLVSTAINMTNGKGIPEAWCYLTTSDGLRFEHGQKRDGDGVMRIPNIPPGTYLAQVSSFGFAVKEHTVEIKTGETVELNDVLYEAGALRWTLIDKNGSPLAGVACRVAPNEPSSIETERTGKTDASGLWIVRGLYPGEYTVTSTLASGKTVSEVISIQAHQLTQKTIMIE